MVPRQRFLWDTFYIFILPPFLHLFIGVASKLYMLNITRILIQVWVICSVDVGLHKSIAFLLHYTVSMIFPAFVFTSLSWSRSYLHKNNSIQSKVIPTFSEYFVTSVSTKKRESYKVLFVCRLLVIPPFHMLMCNSHNNYDSTFAITLIYS